MVMYRRSKCTISILFVTQREKLLDDDMEVRKMLKGRQQIGLRSEEGASSKASASAGCRLGAVMISVDRLSGKIKIEVNGSY